MAGPDIRGMSPTYNQAKFRGLVPLRIQPFLIRRELDMQTTKRSADCRTKYNWSTISGHEPAGKYITVRTPQSAVFAPQRAFMKIDRIGSHLGAAEQHLSGYTTKVIHIMTSQLFFQSDMLYMRLNGRFSRQKQPILAVRSNLTLHSTRFLKVSLS